MKTYSVCIPVVGEILTEVEADSESDAIKKAMNMDFSNDDIENWSTYHRINSGNVCHVDTAWDASAELIEG